jgi:hypothetical protein
VANEVDSIYGFYNSKGVVHIKFTDLAGHGYYHTNARSTMGFYCIVTDTCYNFLGKEYEYRNGVRIILADKLSLAGFIIADEFDSVDLHKSHTLSEVVEDPVEGWTQIEWYYFKHQDLFFYSEISFTIPIYIFRDKEIIKFYLAKVKLSGDRESDISILDVREVL